MIIEIIEKMQANGFIFSHDLHVLIGNISLQYYRFFNSSLFLKSNRSILPSKNVLKHVIYTANLSSALISISYYLLEE